MAKKIKLPEDVERRLEELIETAKNISFEELINSSGDDNDDSCVEYTHESF